MSGGILQLVAKGVESIYLVENPQITHFKIVYRRHTNFSIFDHKLNFTKKLKLGGRVTYKIRNIADILYNLVLVIDLPDINMSFEKPTGYYIKTILAKYGILWTGEDEILVTRDIYDSEIKELIFDTVALIEQKYSDTNNLLSVIDKYYGIEPDIYSGRYFLLNYENVDLKFFAVDLGSIGIDIHNRDTQDISNIYIFINSEKFDVTGATLTLVPDTDIAINGIYSYVTSTYLSSASDQSGSDCIYAAIRMSSLSATTSAEQTLTLTGNIYMDGPNIALFRYKQSDNLVGNIPYTKLFKNSSGDVELFTEYPDEFDNIFFLYDTDGITLDDDMVIDLNDPRVLSNDSGVIYCSKQYLENYIEANGESGTYIAINRHLYINTVNTSVNLPLYAYKHVPSGTYTNFPSDCIEETEKFYGLVSKSSLFDQVAPMFFPFWGEREHMYIDIVSDNVYIVSESTLNSNQTVTVSDTQLKTYTYTWPSGTEFDFIERVELENLEHSRYKSTHKYVAIKRSDVTVNSGTITFPKSSVARGMFPTQYNYYTDNIVRTDTIIGRIIVPENKYDSNNIEHIYYRVRERDNTLTLVEHPYIFMIKTLAYVFSLDSSYIINQATYTGLIALMDDVGENIDRNIIMENMVNIRITMYSEFISHIFNIKKVYGGLLLSYPANDITNGSSVVWTDPVTGINTTKTIVVSHSRDNIQFIHAIDMANYSNIPVKSSSISMYYDYVINASYPATQLYTYLDAYVIYRNYISEFKSLGTSAQPVFGYYDSTTLNNTALKIATSINNNYKSNSEMFYQILSLLYKIKSGLSTSAIHTSVVYTTTSVDTTSSHKITYGLLKAGNDSRHNVNIINDIIRVAIDDNVTIYFKTIVSTVFNNFLESIRSISSDSIMRGYFDKLVYWNECMTSSIISHISDTSMSRTFAIKQTFNTSSKYIEVYGTKRIILNHIPYALIQNIPYAVRKIILNGGLLNISSEVFAFPSIITAGDRTRFKNVLTDYLCLELSSIDFTDIYKDGTDSDVNKRTLMEEFEEFIFTMIIASDRTDSTTYYNSSYFNSLVSSGDSSHTYYIISPFTIEAVASLGDETGLTAVEYVIKKFKQIYKKILTDFVEFVNNGYFTSSGGSIQTISDLTGGAHTTITFTFVENLYNYICTLLDGYITGPIVAESVYSRTYSLFTSHIFTDIRVNNPSTSHNHKFLDVQSAIWNTIQKQNIRAFNELMYNGLLSRDVLKSVGGLNILSYYDDFINLISSNINPPVIYTGAYIDTNGVSHVENYNINHSDITPVGKTGIDFYRLRFDSEYDNILTKLSADMNYYVYLHDSRYTRLKKILNIKYINLFHRTYMHNSVEEIIKQLSRELVNKYNIKQDTYSAEMIDIIGFESGTYEDFRNVALKIYNTTYSAFDMIKSEGGVINSGDNIYNLIFMIKDASSNPYDSTNRHLQEWYDTYSSTISMNDVYNYFETLISNIYPSTLTMHPKKDTFFMGYARYTDVVLFLLDRILTTTPFMNSFYSMLDNSYNSMADIYNTMTSTLTDMIESYGDKIFNKLTFMDGSVDYKINDTAIVGGETRYYRYAVFSMDDLTIEGSNLDKNILNVLSQESPKFKYVKLLGHRIIDYMRISYGAQELDKQSGELLDHIASITIPPEQIRGYNQMIGYTNDMCSFNSRQKPIKRLYIPFRLFFCGDVSAGIPLTNLLHTDIFIDIKLNDISDILITEPGAYFINIPKINSHMIGSFVYLDETERPVMARSRLEFLITRYQYGGDQIFSKKDIYQENKIRIRSGFSDPSKYLYWKMCYEKDGITVDKDNWCDMELIDENNEYVKSMDMCKIKFNGVTREEYKDYDYYNLYQPYTRKIYNMRMGNFVYSFANNPLVFQPTGSASMGNIHDLTLIVKLHPDAVKALNDLNYRIIWKVWSYGMNIIAVISGIGGLRFFGN
jgi:hypothetical protein